MNEEEQQLKIWYLLSCFLIVIISLLLITPALGGEPDISGVYVGKFTSGEKEKESGAIEMEIILNQKGKSLAGILLITEILTENPVLAYWEFKYGIIEKNKVTFIGIDERWIGGVTEYLFRLFRCDGEVRGKDLQGSCIMIQDAKKTKVDRMIFSVTRK